MSELRTLRVETCQFKRLERSDWEYGIIINEGNGPIIDMDGKPVASEPQIWNWRPVSDSVLTVKLDVPVQERKTKA